MRVFAQLNMTSKPKSVCRTPVVPNFVMLIPSEFKLTGRFETVPSIWIG